MDDESDEIDAPVQMPPKKRKLNTTVIENKAAALRRLQEGAPVREVAREYNVTPKTVRDWRQQSAKIDDQAHKRDRRRMVDSLCCFPKVIFKHVADRRRPQAAVPTIGCSSAVVFQAATATKLRGVV